MLDLSDIDQRLQHRLATETKLCHECGDDKTIRDFYVRIRTRKPKGNQFISVREICKACHKRASVLRRRLSPNGSRFGHYRKNSMAKGLEFSITREFLGAALLRDCAYCGCGDLLMTLDRADNDVGYVESNVVPACIRCNLLKADMPREAWEAMVGTIRQVYESGKFGAWVPRNVRVNSRQDMTR